MDEAIEISVLARHVHYGVRGNCTRCPIALAIIDAGYAHPYVGSNIEFQSKTSSAVFAYHIPKEVSNFMMDFDRTGKGKPFTFRLSQRMLTTLNLFINRSY